MLKQDIDQFLSGKQIAFVGVSRIGSKFSNKVYQKLREFGCEVHLVHPRIESIDGVGCVPSVKELPDDVRSLMIVSSPGVCASVLKDVSETKIDSVWVFLGPGKKPDIDAEIERLKNTGVSVISGYCPFMFIEPVAPFHAAHRFFVKLFGRYPG